VPEDLRQTIPELARVMTSISDTGPQHLPAARSHLQRCAHDDALHRQIDVLETRASEALRDRAVESGRRDDVAVRSGRLQVERQAQIRENFEFVQRQIEAKEKRRRDEHAKKAEDLAESAISVPCGDIRALHKRDVLTSEAKEACAEQIAAAAAACTSGSVSCASDGAERRAQRELRNALDEQVQARKAKREALKKSEMYMDARLLEMENREAAERRQAEQAARLQEREMLNGAWREETKIRDIRRQIEAIELGKRLPGSKTNSEYVELRLPASGLVTSRGLDTSRGSPGSGSVTPKSSHGLQSTLMSARAGSATTSVRGGTSIQAAPLSARGDALGAVAALALQQKAIEAT